MCQMFSVGGRSGLYHHNSFILLEYLQDVVWQCADEKNQELPEKMLSGWQHVAPKPAYIVPQMCKLPLSTANKLFAAGLSPL